MGKMEKSSSFKFLMTLSLGAFCISFAAIFVKLLGRDFLGPTAIGFWRTLFGAGILFLWVIITKNSLRLPLPLWGLSLLAGFIFFLDLFFWHRSILYSAAGMATILANTQVFWVAIWGVFIFKEKLRLGFWLLIFFAFIGVVLLIGVGSEVVFTTIYLEGVTFGLLTGVIYSSYIIVLKITGQKKECPNFITLMAWISFFTSLFFGIAMLVESDSFILPDISTVFVLLALALVVQALGWWLISSSLPKLKASQSGLILLLQPMLATIWGVMFLGEHLYWMQLLGAVITLAAIYWGSVKVANDN
ncbi:MAG: DMT family transporter [FCB group bacterium]|nr:DMT family transporter [FCB group bacterium]